jgi:hypothetical protein
MVQRFWVVAIAGACAWLPPAAVHAQACPTPAAVTSACTGAGCAIVALPAVSGARGSTVQIPISFTAGPNDSQDGKGFDEVSAIAFTLGVPGTGDAAPLAFDCTSGDLAAGSVQVGNANANDFTVVIENAQCTNRTHCLCPDTSAGQTLDNFVNIVVYGPKTLPEQGPVTIPVLKSGTLVTLTMRLAQDAPDQVPLRIFSALDQTKPQFAANLSIGDKSACDVTANAQSRSNVAFTPGQVAAGTPGPSACVGDCNGNNAVAINELIIGVNIALGNQALSACAAFDANHDNKVTINELITAVNNALNGCHATS